MLVRAPSVVSFLKLLGRQKRQQPAKEQQCVSYLIAKWQRPRPPKPISEKSASILQLALHTSITRVSWRNFRRLALLYALSDDRGTQGGTLIGYTASRGGLAERRSAPLPPESRSLQLSQERRRSGAPAYRTAPRLDREGEDARHRGWTEKTPSSARAPPKKQSRQTRTTRKPQETGPRTPPA